MNNIIEVKNISKSFHLPLERVDNLRDRLFTFFKTKNYREFKALCDISFEIKPGEFVGIIGKNGSGKSTLLKILAGVYEPDSGKIVINGKVSPFLELGVGFNGELSARDNIYLNATILGLSEEKIDEKFDKIIEFAELEDFVETKVKNFSSGMYARLAFSVAIEADADIYLMDEVLAVGDVSFQRKCFRKFAELRTKGKTIILVSHDISMIERFANKTLLLEKGKLKLIDKTKGVVDNYIIQNIEYRNDNIFTKDKKVKLVEINQVSISDKNSFTKNVLNLNENFKIHLGLGYNSKVNCINIGIGIYNEDGSYVFGCNTQIDEYKLNSPKEVEIIFKDPNLLPGKYTLYAVCFGEQENNYYDYRPKILNFHIADQTRSKDWRGIVNLDYTWNQK